MGGDKIEINSDNIIKITVTFLVYLFVVVISYFLLSTPVELILSSFEGIEAGEATDELALYLPWFKSAMTMFWAIFVAIPVTWFIMKIFSREPAYYQYRRY